MLAFAFVLALSSNVAAHVDVAPSDPTTVEARALSDQGRMAYAEGRYEVARAWFRLAWDKKKLPELVFNIAQCDFQLGEHDEAVRHYEQYVKLAPTAPNRALVDDLIRESKAKLKRRPKSGAVDAVNAAVRAVVPSSLRGDGSSRAPSPNVLVDGDEPIIWAGAIAAGTVTLVAVGAVAWAMTQPSSQ
jgi:tetratricopeptide (TPR) repeat protein